MLPPWVNRVVMLLTVKGRLSPQWKKDITVCMLTFTSTVREQAHGLDTQPHLKKRSDSIGMRCASLLGNVNMVFGGRTKESSDLKSSAETNRKLVREKKSTGSTSHLLHLMNWSSIR